MPKLLMRFLTVLLLVPLLAHAGEKFEEGKHYIRLSQPIPTTDPAKVEVMEAFWYGCPHCYQLEPYIEPWARTLAYDVNFRKVPALFGKEWKVHGQLYYTVQALGLDANKVDAAIFHSIHQENRRLNQPDSMAKFLKLYDVSEEQFTKAYNSFGVRNQLRQADSLIRGAQLTGVPALVVNGKYRISAREAGSAKAMLEVADFLIKKEREALKSKG
ncbi:thiol:disulfide interchange protein [Elysia marginata]|uniref:Thiol:disulfide interchange protein DsbA n=1 Tax=Elysia marginata TaxID=1093978 RepID=A0AAV4FI13_9GAST|nr:thiol:disulfide interchange protein [Elysia marginata]